MDNNTKETIKMRPASGQYVIDNLPMMTMVVCGLAVCGIENYWIDSLKSVTACVTALCLLCLAYRLVYLLGTRYEITQEQLIHRHGVFTRKSDYVELYRIVDYAEQKSILQQLARLKTITVYSGDRTNPEIRLIGIRAGCRVTEIIRNRVEQNKKRRGIYEITNR